MGLDLHTIDMPNGYGPQLSDRLKLALAVLSVPAAGAAVTALGSITAGTGFDVLPIIAPSGGTETAGVTPAVPAIARATSLKCVSASPATPGTGVAINDTFTLAGGTLAAAGPNGNTLNAAGVATLLTVSKAQLVGAALTAGGSGSSAGYAANDVLTLVGGTEMTAAQVTVLTVDSGGGILTWEISRGGVYSVEASTFTVTGGTGSGATFGSAAWGAEAFTITHVGGYTIAPATPNAPTNGTGTGTGVTVTCAFGLGTAVIDEGGNYSAAPSWTVTPADGNGSGASIATGTLGGAGAAVVRALPLDLPCANATVIGASNQALDAVIEVVSLVGAAGLGNPNSAAPYISVAVQPRLAANALTAGQVCLLVAA
jgi:hypothetical protein